MDRRVAPHIHSSTQSESQQKSRCNDTCPRSDKKPIQEARENRCPQHKRHDARLQLERLIVIESAGESPTQINKPHDQDAYEVDTMQQSSQVETALLKKAAQPNGRPAGDGQADDGSQLQLAHVGVPAYLLSLKQWRIKEPNSAEYSKQCKSATRFRPPQASHDSQSNAHKNARQ